MSRQIQSDSWQNWQQFRQWQSGFLCRICHADSEKSANSSDSESVLMYIPNHLDDVKVRRGRGFASGKPLHPIDMIADWEGERVTIWKTIWSLFLMGGTNGFEEAGREARLRDGWRWVCRVNRK